MSRHIYAKSTDRANDQHRGGAVLHWLDLRLNEHPLPSLSVA
jgi:hypothetical protein